VPEPFEQIRKVIDGTTKLAAAVRKATAGGKHYAAPQVKMEAEHPDDESEHRDQATMSGRRTQGRPAVVSQTGYNTSEDAPQEPQ